MKISQMIEREPFYDINLRTLSGYFGDASESKPLYVYPRINAIISRSPSTKVKSYLYNEFRVVGPIWKTLLAKLYVFLCLNTRGIFSSRKISIPNSMTADMLIFPCNRRYRIFNFEDGIVDVIGKAGFPLDTMHKEIAYRQESNDEYVIPIEEVSADQYAEPIIDGTPLARIIKEQYSISRSVLEMFEQSKLDDQRASTAGEYSVELVKSVSDKLAENSTLFNPQCITTTRDLLKKIRNHVDVKESITIAFSHGDLQKGNVWIEDLTGKMIIIDWETYQYRSIWYDRVVLLENLHSGEGLYEWMNRCNTGYFETMTRSSKMIVLMEEIESRVSEVLSLPSLVRSTGYPEFIDRANSDYDRFIEES